jgi:hypothetical protein
VKRQVPETVGDSGPGSLSQSFISYYRERRLISRDDAPTQGWLTKDGALELLSLSLNNNKGFSKKAIIFSEFQAFSISAPGLVDNSFDPRFGCKVKFSPGDVSMPLARGQTSALPPGDKSGGYCKVKTWSGFPGNPG